MKTDLNFLRKLVATGSPTGREQDLQRYLAEWAKPFASSIQADKVGNVAVVINPDAPLRVMLAGHCDRIGFIVMKITKEGCIRIDPLGGVDEATMLGAHVVIHTEKGDIPGIIGKVSTHLQSKAEKDAVPTVDHVWIDIGARDKADAEQLVKIGDYVSYDLTLRELSGSRITAPGLDNMTGLYAIMQVAKECAAANIAVALYCVSTVQEEIGARGAKVAASAIDPHVAIAVDTTLAMDTPSKPKTLTTPRIQLGGGPTILQGPSGHPGLVRQFKQIAHQNNISHQIEINADVASNDAKTMQLADIGTASGSIGIPLRNMHTQVEIVDMNDVNATIRLLVEFIKSLSADADLSPVNYDENGNKTNDLQFDLIGHQKEK